MSEVDIQRRRLDALRGLAGACQCIPGSISALRLALAGSAMETRHAILPLLALAGWYAPVCRDKNLLRWAWAEYRTVSRRPRRLCGIAAPSATEALIKLAQHIIQTANNFARIGIEELAAQRRRPEGPLLDCFLARWPLIRDALVGMSIPSKRQLEKFQVESDWEYGQALRRWEVEQKGLADGAGDEQNAPLKNLAYHSVDFRSVCWFGSKYTFTGTQAACVRVLWQAWAKKGAPTMSQATILDAAGSTGARLRDAFNKGKHPAWNTMIVKSGKDAFRLAEPPQ